MIMAATRVPHPAAPVPTPHRAQLDIVHVFLSERFKEPFLLLSEPATKKLLAIVASGRILGGQTYDALIAFTAAEHDASLMSLDQRTVIAYEAVGVRVEPLVSRTD